MLLFALGMFLLSDAIMDVFRGSETSFDTVPFHALGRTLMWLMLSWAAFDAVSLIVGGALHSILICPATSKARISNHS